jgi:sugar O-acyltransferase (sialic acid O-acetyltransferase NeuD family)
MSEMEVAADPSRRVVLWGATGHSKSLRESLARSGYLVTALFDNNTDLAPPWSGVRLYHGLEGFRRWLSDHRDADQFLVAIGGSRGADRRQIQATMASHGLKPLTWVDCRSCVAADALLRPGSQVLMGACVGAEARLGRSVIVNTRASVDHECELEDGVHIAPGAVLCGVVRICRDAMIGAGAIVLPRRTIGEGSIVGAGSIVTRDIPDRVVAFGQPARVVRRLNPPEELAS